MTKLCLCIFLQLLACCLSDIITEYKSIQEDGEVTDLDMLHCQLRANGNMSCAIRFDTAVSNGVLEERERCEQLSLEWCMSASMDPGYTYVGKSTVVYTPPFTFYHYPVNPSWEIWENIPIAIKQGAQISILFTAVGAWSEIRIAFRNAVEAVIYTKYLSPESSDIISDVVSTVTVVFDATEMFYHVGGVVHTSGEIGTSVMNIRIFNVVFWGEKGNIHRVSYRAAD